MIKVAAEYGLSDVAVKKMCRKMNVPTPPRGYWARLAAGHRVKKPVLPKQHDVATARVDPARNAQRREQSQRVATLHNNMDPLEIPAELGINQLHPQARAVHAALKKAKPDHHGIVDTHTDNLPLVHVAVSNVDRVSRVLHVVFSELESRGLSLQPVRLHDRKRLGFQQGEDAMTLSIEEPIISIKRPPTPEELRRPSREWKLESYQPSGNFRVVLHECYGTWSNRSLLRNEGPRRPLGMLLAEIVDGIWDYFVRKETDRQRKKAEAEAEAKRQQLEAERSRRAAEERAAQVAIRKEEERQENHRQKLASLAAARVENALRAAEWWRLHRVMLDYAAECERQWIGNGETPSPLTEEQRQWLSWVRAEASAMSPFAFGYPDFSKDGPFDGSGIAVDGPYPSIASLPLPPTMQPPEEALPKEAAPAPQPKASPPPAPPSYSPAPPQYPFWLLHRNRR